jgi:hypothetical protein
VTPTWVPIWAVRHDASTIDVFELRDWGGRLVQVRTPGEKAWARWTRPEYAKRFGATPEEAIARFLAQAQREVVAARTELEAAEALVERARLLTPEQVRS